MKYKIGQQFIVIDTSACPPRTRLGDKAEIIKVERFFIEMKFYDPPEKYGLDGYCWRFCNNDGLKKTFKLLNFLQIGDKVKCIEGISQGTIGYIRHIGKLEGRGEKNSVWSDWNPRFNKKLKRTLTYLDEEILQKVNSKK